MHIIAVAILYIANTKNMLMADECGGFSKREVSVLIFYSHQYSHQSLMLLKKDWLFHLLVPGCIAYVGIRG